MTYETRSLRRLGIDRHLLLRVVSPEARPGDDHNLRLLGQAVEDRSGKQGFAEYVGPFLRGTVTGQEDAEPIEQNRSHA